MECLHLFGPKSVVFPFVVRYHKYVDTIRQESVVTTLKFCLFCMGVKNWPFMLRRKGKVTVFANRTLKMFETERKDVIVNRIK
jgi:hypothetical protein